MERDAFRAFKDKTKYPVTHDTRKREVKNKVAHVRPAPAIGHVKILVVGVDIPESGSLKKKRRGRRGRGRDRRDKVYAQFYPPFLLPRPHHTKGITFTSVGERSV